MHHARSTFFALAVAATTGCTAPPATPEPFDGRALLEAEVREQAEWQRERRLQLDSLFARVAQANRSDEALDWLRVYLLSQVADERDHAVRAGSARRFDERLAAFESKLPHRADPFAADLARIQDEVAQVRSLLAAAAPAPLDEAEPTVAAALEGR